MVLINQCYPAIFYSEFPIKTLTHINYISELQTAVPTDVKNKTCRR